MNIYFHKNFLKDYKKLNNPQQNKFKERKNLFLRDEYNPILNNHSLTGKYKGYRSLNVTGDLRAIFKQSKDMVIFIAINSHSNLYTTCT